MKNQLKKREFNSLISVQISLHDDFQKHAESMGNETSMAYHKGCADSLRWALNAFNKKPTIDDYYNLPSFLKNKGGD